LENRKIVKAATGLGGGIGHEGDTCGALTGGVLSLGLYHRNNDCNRLWPDCIEYYRRFNTRHNSSKCKDITGIKFKESYDIRRFLLKGMKCLRLVYTSIESIFDIVEMAERKSPSKGTYQVRPPFDIKRFHCAGTVLSHIESRINLNIGSISRIARGFSGGIAFQGDICGAFMGGVLALGIMYGTDLRRTQHSRLFRAGLVAMKEGGRVFQNEHLHPSFKTSLRVGMLYKKFVSQFGSADCIDILDKVSGSKNRGSCEEVARIAARLAFDIMSVHK
jgi:C_GCAxxG_C_C family probable redox protein